MSIFREDRELLQKQEATELVDVFFKGLQVNPSEKGYITSNISYRKSQHELALDIMRAIRDNKILLMQAGVGIGKTFGYLIPIFYTINNVKEFNKVIISTSSIALQEQLVGDIAKVSKMLGIKVQYGLAKGMNNYACLKKIEDVMYGFRTEPETKKLLTELRDEIRKVRSSDKADLRPLSEEIWNMIKLSNRGACSNCSYSKRCPYYRRQEQMKDWNIIVTNHANMIYNETHHTELVEGVNLKVFDEGHKVIDAMREESELNLDEIKELIMMISTMLSCRYSNRKVTFSYEELNGSLRNNDILFTNLDKLFSRVMASASKNFFESQKKIGNNGAYSVTDNGRIGFWFTDTVKKHLDIVLEELDKLFKEIRNYQEKYKTRLDDRIISKLLKLYKTLKDLRKGEESNNIYWASYYEKNRISIRYVPKDISDISRQLLSGDGSSIILSATMDGKNDYDLPYNELCLQKITGKNIDRAKSYNSPYNYKDNTLFYYDTNLPSPSKDANYIEKLALEVVELIKATNGKALVLFTSKVTMKAVYEIVSNVLKSENYPFELLLQTDNTEEIKEKFVNAINSSLFATGAFWEGIDIKGPSLSNVIITQLPFETYDAVNQYLSRNYVDKERTIHIPKMVMKLTQGVGRLIRSDTDTGIVCCLDSRITGYLTQIKASVPFPEFTTDKKDLYNFIDNKILGQSNQNRKALEQK